MTHCSPKQNAHVEEAIRTISGEPEQIDAIARIRRWFAPDASSDLYSNIQAYVNGETDLSTTVDKITTPIDKQIEGGQTKDLDLMPMWHSIFHSAKRISYTTPEGFTKLVTLLKALKKHPEPSKTDSPIWADLRDINLAAREAINDAPGGGGASFSVPEIHAWANLHYFFASVTKDGVANLDFCIMAMRSALEEEHQNDPAGIPNSATAAQKYDGHVPAAAAWVLVLQEDLYRKEEDLTPKAKNQGNPARGGALWKGKAEFSKERFALWRKRFGEVAGMKGLRRETTELAREACGIMERCERT